MRSLASAVSLWGRQLAVSVRGAVETPRPLCPARPRQGTRPGDATGGRDPRTRFKAKRPHAQEDVRGSVIYKSERPRSRSARPRGARHVKSRHVGPERSGMRIT